MRALLAAWFYGMYCYPERERGAILLRHPRATGDVAYLRSAVSRYLTRNADAVPPGARDPITRESVPRRLGLPRR